MAERDHALLRSLYLEARELPARDREELLRQRCGVDEGLRRAVLELIADETPGRQEPTELDASARSGSARSESGGADPDRVGPYRIEGVLGRGGMGVVYRARDDRLDRAVALKFLHPELGEKRALRDRFQQEARAASALDHPNICTIYDIGEHEGAIFIAMAYYEGASLADRDPNALDTSRVVDLARQLASGLAAAHERGIVHRDLKPANLMVTADGTLKILDFGIAKLGDAVGLTRTGAALGTPGYMAPEQMRGEPVGPQADVWAFGVLMYELLTGRRPFAEDSATALLYSVLEREPAPLSELRSDLPTWLSELIHRCLAKASRLRPPDGAALVAALDPETADAGTMPRSDAETLQVPSARVSRGLLPAARPNDGELRPEPARRWLWLSVPLAALIAIFGFVTWDRSARSSAERGLEPAAAASEERPAVVVLPFALENPEGELAAVANALAERVTHRLARATDARTFATSSVLELRRQGLADGEIASRLGADLSVTGRLDPRGETLSVGVELSATETGEQLWGQRFDEDRTDLIAVEQRVAGEVAAAIAAELDRPPPALLEEVGTADRAAYRAYLEGIHLSQSADFEAAYTALRQATELDPGFAAAWSALSGAEAYLAFFGRRERESTFESARDHARRALSLDPNLADGWNALARVFGLAEGDLEAAADAAKRALEIEPTNAGAHYLLGMAHLNRDEMEAALERMREVLELDPMSRATRMQMLRALRRLGRFQEAIELGEQSRRLHPDFRPVDLELAMAYWHAGDRTRAVNVAPPPWNELLASLRDGDQERAAEVAESLMTGARSDPANLAPTVVALCLVGHFDQALDRLNDYPAGDVGRVALLQVLPDPALDPLRTTRRFRGLLEERRLALSFAIPRTDLGIDLEATAGEGSL